MVELRWLFFLLHFSHSSHIFSENYLSHARDDNTSFTLSTHVNGIDKN